MYYSPKMSQKIFRYLWQKGTNPKILGKFSVSHWMHILSFIPRKNYNPNLILTAYILILNLLDRNFFKSFESIYLCKSLLYSLPQMLDVYDGNSFIIWPQVHESTSGMYLLPFPELSMPLCKLLKRDGSIIFFFSLSSFPKKTVFKKF